MLKCMDHVQLATEPDFTVQTETFDVKLLPVSSNSNQKTLIPHQKIANLKM